MNHPLWIIVVGLIVLGFGAFWIWIASAAQHLDEYDDDRPLDKTDDLP